MNALPSTLQTLFPLLIALMVIAALALLWRRDRSAWLLAALAGEGISLVFNVALIVLPEVVRSLPQLFSVWTLGALMFAFGLLGYAVERNQKR